MAPGGAVYVKELWRAPKRCKIEGKDLFFYHILQARARGGNILNSSGGVRKRAVASAKEDVKLKVRTFFLVMNHEL